MVQSSPLMLLALPLLAYVALLVPGGLAGGNYDRLMSELDKRNRAMHSQYVQRLGPDQPNFFDAMDSRVAELQAKHYVRDSQYSGSFDPEKYWADLLERPTSAIEAEQLGDADDEDMDEALVSDRRVEEPFLNRIWGNQKVSGGAGESGQVTGPHNHPQEQKVKTDSLPSYCDPPNPCPVGVDPKKARSPCSTTVQDTAEYNYADTLRKMATEQCPCDSEHMQCPTIAGSVTAKRSGHPINPYLLNGRNNKIDSKKSPKYALSGAKTKRGVKANFKSAVMVKKNPWLDSAEALDTVEKKDGRHEYEFE